LSDERREREGERRREREKQRGGGCGWVWRAGGKKNEKVVEDREKEREVGVLTKNLYLVSCILGLYL
jgi:hypothetical protein